MDCLVRGIMEERPSNSVRKRVRKRVKSGELLMIDEEKPKMSESGFTGLSMEQMGADIIRCVRCERRYATKLPASSKEFVRPSPQSDSFWTEPQSGSKSPAASGCIPPELAGSGPEGKCEDKRGVSMRFSGIQCANPECKMTICVEDDIFPCSLKPNNHDLNPRCPPRRASFIRPIYTRPATSPSHLRRVPRRRLSTPAPCSRSHAPSAQASG